MLSIILPHVEKLGQVDSEDPTYDTFLPPTHPTKSREPAIILPCAEEKMAGSPAPQIPKTFYSAVRRASGNILRVGNANCRSTDKTYSELLLLLKRLWFDVMKEIIMFYKLLLHVVSGTYRLLAHGCMCPQVLYDFDDHIGEPIPMSYLLCF